MAKFKIGEVEEQARSILLDTYEDAYRFAPREIYRAMQDAVAQTRSIRPESQYVDGLLVDDTFALPEGSELGSYRALDVAMERRWREAIVYYVVYRMYLKDDPDTQNATLASQYLQLYTSSVKS